MWWLSVLLPSDCLDQPIAKVWIQLGKDLIKISRWIFYINENGSWYNNVHFIYFLISPNIKIIFIIPIIWFEEIDLFSYNIIWAYSQITWILDFSILQISLCNNSTILGVSLSMTITNFDLFFACHAGAAWQRMPIQPHSKSIDRSRGVDS